jgi:heme-degrading monooxygenase HmoA
MLKMQVKPERIDEAARLFAEDIIPNCREQAGYRGAYFLVDRKLGECVPVTLWTTEAATASFGRPMRSSSSTRAESCRPPFVRRSPFVL